MIFHIRGVNLSQGVYIPARGALHKSVFSTFDYTVLHYRKRLSANQSINQQFYFRTKPMCGLVCKARSLSPLSHRGMQMVSLIGKLSSVDFYRVKLSSGRTNKTHQYAHTVILQNRRPAPLKLRPYGAIEIRLLLFFTFGRYIPEGV